MPLLRNWNCFFWRGEKCWSYRQDLLYAIYTRKRMKNVPTKTLELKDKLLNLCAYRTWTIIGLHNFLYIVSSCNVCFLLLSFPILLSIYTFQPKQRNKANKMQSGDYLWKNEENKSLRKGRVKKVRLYLESVIISRTHEEKRFREDIWKLRRSVRNRK